MSMTNTHAPKITYSATYEGKTATRTSARKYTHALALHFDGRDGQEPGWDVVSFHASAELALKAAKDRIWDWRTDKAVAVPVVNETAKLAREARKSEQQAQRDAIAASESLSVDWK